MHSAIRGSQNHITAMLSLRGTVEVGWYSRVWYGKPLKKTSVSTVFRI